MAEQYLAAGDSERAAREYMRAFNIDHEPQYLIKAAAIQFEDGGIRDAVATLRLGNAEQPNSVDILEAVLGHLWRLSDVTGGQTDWRSMRDFSGRLLEINPDHVLALMSSSEALRFLKENESDIDKATEQFVRAKELEPYNPRVVLAEVNRLFDRTAIEARAGLPLDRLRAEPERLAAISNDLYVEAKKILDSALEHAPYEPHLVLRKAMLMFWGDENTRQRDEACDELAEAVEANPDDPDLRLALGMYLVTRTDELIEGMDVAERDRRLDLAKDHLQKCLELEPAIFEAYGELARIELLRVDPNIDPTDDLKRRYHAALDIYGGMMNDTATLVSLRAVVGGRRRARMIETGFNDAMAYYAKTPDDGERTALIEIAAKFVGESSVRYPELLSTLRMQGMLAIARRDEQSAIQDFTQLYDRTADVVSGEGATYNADAANRLALLHSQRGQIGEAERYATAALVRYQDLGQTPPLELLMIQLEAMLDTGRAQEAYDRIDALLAIYPEEARLIRVKMLAAERLGNRGEAQRLSERLGDTVGAALQKAGWAMAERDFATAENILLEAIESHPNRRVLIDTLTNVMLAADRRTELQAVLQKYLEQSTDESAKRVLESYLVVASATDEAERDAKLREIIERDPDIESRYSNLFNYCMGNGDLSGAQKYLDELETYLRESKAETRKVLDVLERQFIVAIERKDLTRASKYAVQLAEQNADLVNGARYRGMMALAQGDGETALRELRVADHDLPPEAHLKTLLAQAYLMVKPERYEEALAALEEAVRINPTHARALNLLFKVKELTGFASDDEYRTLLRNAFAANRNDAYLAARVAALVEHEQPLQAIARREQLRSQNPEDLDNLTRLASLYVTPPVNEPEKARDVLEAGIEVAREVPAGPEARTRLQSFYSAAAAFYAQQGNRAAGEELLKTFAGQVSGADSVHVQILLASFYERLGDLEQARKTLQEALEMVGTVVPDAAERAEISQQVGLALIDFLTRTRQVGLLPKACHDVLTTLTDGQDDLRQRLRLRVVETLSSLDDEQAPAEINAYLKDYPDDYRVLSLKARLLFLENRLEDARAVLSRVLELNPDYAPSRFVRGGINLDLRRFDEARTDLLEAKRLAPTAFDMRHRLILAQLYELTGEVELAEGELLSILDEGRASPQVVARVSQYLLRLYRKTNRLEKADDMITRYAARQPDNAFWPYQRGMLFMERGEPGLAVRPLQEAVQLTEAKNELMVADWLRAMTMAARPREALDAFDKLTPEQRTPLVCVSAAEAHAKLNQKREAGKVLTTALSEAAESSLDALLAVSQRAINYYPESDVTSRREMVSDLISFFTLLLNEPNQNPAKIVRLKTVVAESWSRSGQPEEALKMLNQALEAAPADTSERVTILLSKAQALSARGDPFNDEIRGLYDEVLAIDANNMLALNNLAYLLASSGKPEQALQYAERLRALKAENAATWDTIGAVYMKNERWDDAQTALQRALLLDGESVEGNLHMGQVLVERGQAGDARRYLERARDRAKELGRTELEAEAEAALEAQR
ncbi:MAG: tetratricopeptide repeat protein [Phycisphaerae bacterium]|nr:tetratricopeptide repeat protein [Phycisphaerae bacterium]